MKNITFVEPKNNNMSMSLVKTRQRESVFLNWIHHWQVYQGHSRRGGVYDGDPLQE